MKKIVILKIYFNSYVRKILSNYFKKSVKFSAKPKHKKRPPDVFLWKDVLRNMQQNLQDNTHTEVWF